MDTESHSHSAHASPEDGRHRLQPRPEWQRQRLARWLAEWRLDQAWQQACAEDATDQDIESSAATDPTEPQSHLVIGAGLRKLLGIDTAPRTVLSADQLVKPYDSRETFQPGCIRVLSPALVPHAGRPVALAVLGDWEPGWLLTAPFGRFSEPATTGELLLESREPLHRVLCLWNAVTLPASLLQQSWADGELTDAEVRDAWTVFRHVTTGAPLPEPLITRIGPPIVVPDDPRIVYQAEETESLAALRAQTASALQMESRS